MAAPPIPIVTFSFPSGGAGGARGGGGSRFVLGSVATRASVPNNRFANTGSFTNRTYHICRETCRPRPAWANVALVNPSGEASGGTLTTYGEIEYPTGVYTPLTWNGSPSVVAAPGEMPIPDKPDVEVPEGAGFHVGSRQIGSQYVLYADGTQKATSLGDAQQSGGTDMRNVVNNGASVTFPSLILGETTKRSILMIGDSRIAGFSDQADAGSQGNNGDFQVGFSPNYAGTRYGCVGLTAANFASNHALALLLAQYHTDVIINLGINDIIGNTSLATLRTLTSGNIALFTGKRVWLSTIQPANSSNNQWIDLAGQTPGAHDGVRLADNDDIRGGYYTGAAGYFEYANIVQAVADATAWNFDGTPFKYTGDGAHLTSFATRLAGPFTLT